LNLYFWIWLESVFIDISLDDLSDKSTSILDEFEFFVVAVLLILDSEEEIEDKLVEISISFVSKNQ